MGECGQTESRINLNTLFALGSLYMGDGIIYIEISYLFCPQFSYALPY